MVDAEGRHSSVLCSHCCSSQAQPQCLVLVWKEVSDRQSEYNALWDSSQPDTRTASFPLPTLSWTLVFTTLAIHPPITVLWSNFCTLALYVFCLLYCLYIMLKCAYMWIVVFIVQYVTTVLCDYQSQIPYIYNYIRPRYFFCPLSQQRENGVQ